MNVRTDGQHIDEGTMNDDFIDSDDGKDTTD
jgi:hypothetical protein